MDKWPCDPVGLVVCAFKTKHVCSIASCVAIGVVGFLNPTFVYLHTLCDSCMQSVQKFLNYCNIL